MPLTSLKTYQGWCLPLIPSLPTSFASNSGLIDEYLPNWGGCQDLQCGDMHFAENGVTIICEGCTPGSQRFFNGAVYTVVDNQMLRDMAEDHQNHDFSKVCTSNVTNINSLFEDIWSFNQDLSSWDVSNVTNMGRAFRYCFAFDQRPV